MFNRQGDGLRRRLDRISRMPEGRLKRGRTIIGSRCRFVDRLRQHCRSASDAVMATAIDRRDAVLACDQGRCGKRCFVDSRVDGYCAEWCCTVLERH